MRTIISPISLEEKSLSVALLHKTLKVFGLPVAEQEVKRKKVGEDTKTKVRELQKQLNVPADETTLVNELMISAMGEALRARGLMATSRSFTVSGVVRLLDLSVKKQQQLLAFDLDLGGVSIYRKVKTITQIEKSGGFELLGEAISDNRGKYSITFYDWQYQRAERKKADVVVYAIEKVKDEFKIVGRSSLVNSDDYSDKGLVHGVDVVISQADARTEYEKVMSPLSAFLKENKSNLSRIAASSEQLAFVVNELDIEPTRLNIMAVAQLLIKEQEKELSHELLYGIGRQNIHLAWPVLYRKSKDELLAAIAKSIEANIISAFKKNDIAEFLAAVSGDAVKEVLKGKNNKGENTLKAMLSSALPEVEQQIAFLEALDSFKGHDYSEFWSEYLPEQQEFKKNPQLVSDLQFNQQLTLLTGNQQAIVKELQVSRKLGSIDKLFELEDGDWLEIVKKSGLPDFVQGQNDGEKTSRYINSMKSMLSAALPTRQIALMVANDQLPIEKNAVSHGITAFLENSEKFDFASSRIHDFENEIKTAAGENFTDVTQELLKIQRTFQVSTSPEAMTTLLRHRLHSARSIANISPRNFIKTYGKELGGMETAFAIHQRAEHIAARTELSAMHLWEYSHGCNPSLVLGKSEYKEAVKTLQNHLPNYSELFGSPDLCECEHCRSVYSPAAYFVELLRFLWRGEPNSEGKTPLDMLAERRPDLLNLPLTCENTNTIIPYVDLANEVMEFYTANDSLTSFKGHDTGEISEQELRASAQNFNLSAYRKVKNSKYPFKLPYHQPLDVIRTYSDHLKVSRYEVMKATNPQPDIVTARAIAAESLRACDEEYKILTGLDFNGTADTTALYECFGYATTGEMANLNDVQEFLHRSGIAYTDLVGLVKTKFINPYQATVNSLERIFAFASIDSLDIYSRLKRIEAGTLNPANDADIMGAINKYNAENGTNVTANEFAKWVSDHFKNFCQVITLYEPDSKCDLETTSLKTIQSIYEGSVSSGISDENWSRMHRFIRLWRKLGWTIRDTDLMLTALGEKDVTSNTIAKLESVTLLMTDMKLAPNQAAVFWGNIETLGDKSLYKKLFLKKTVQQIDDVFKADVWGKYLQDASDAQGNSITLAKHKSAILAAFRIREDDLAAILSLAKVIDGGNPRLINMNNDKLNLGHLSMLYRYVLLARTLGIQIPEVCKIIDIFKIDPFSRWNADSNQFDHIKPEDTYIFCQLTKSITKTGFKATTLDYIINGIISPDSKIGIDKNKLLNIAKDIHASFSVIENDHPEKVTGPLTIELLAAKLSLTYQTEIVSRFSRILEGTESFQVRTDTNLDVMIPDEESRNKINQLVATGTFGTKDEAAAFLKKLSRKYTYTKGSGRFTLLGVMTDMERAVLKGLSNVNIKFNIDVDVLYAAPEKFIAENLSGILDDLNEANIKLLDHPAQATAAAIEDKAVYVYERFVPLLKSKLRRDAIAQHIAALIGLSEDATALLIARDAEILTKNLMAEGFSAEYFSDATWNNPALKRTDKTIDFAWGASAPHPSVPVNDFSVKWQAYVTAPASGEYTLRVDVKDADNVFKLYLDDELILEKANGNMRTSWDYITTLNAAKMYSLKLDYAKTQQQAGIRLQWFTKTTAPEVIPATEAYPAAILDEFVTLTTVFHRAAKFISGFALSETELNHLINYSADFSNIDFKSITTDHWQRVCDYIALRDSVPQAKSLLTDVFVLANINNPAPSIGDLNTLVHEATAWSLADLSFLVNSHFSLNIDDFKNEIGLNRLCKVMQIINKTGHSAQTVTKWGAAETDFDNLDDTANLIRNTVKAKYTDQDWLDLAHQLSDVIRMNQQAALTNYLLTLPAIQAWGAKDADGLFEYFLIDVQMIACMETSRIVQATAAIQMFVNRCLLNLESDMSSGSEKGISPAAIEVDRWDWMKNYRVWEANRKVFLYPENWLEPEWRNDRSEFFKDLESYLVQNDITERSVEQAFRNYLSNLNEVANLDVCGLYQENYEDGSTKYLHVFARTHNAPYKFYYRRWNQYGKWSPWEKVQVDIRCVEDGDNSGVHLIPVVWKKRLFLFWPEITEAQEPQGGKSTKSVRDAADDSIGSLEARKYWEMRLAWSECVDGKWNPKQITKEILEYSPSSQLKMDYNFCLFIDPGTQELSFSLLCPYQCPGCSRLGPGFNLNDVQSKVNTVDGLFFNDHNMTSLDYCNHFMKFSKISQLSLNGNLYLGESVDHKLLYSPQITDFESSLSYPFFYADDRRTYFVRPVDVPAIEGLRRPDLQKPFLKYPDYESRYPIPDVMPPVGPDPHLAVDVIAPDFSTPIATMAYRSERDNHSSLPDSTPSRVRAATVASARSAEAKNDIMSKGYGLEIAYTGKAFGGAMADKYFERWTIGSDPKLEFHTFYHPYSSKYVTRLNRGGLPLLMESDTEIADDDGAVFEIAYGPNFADSMVKRYTDFEKPPEFRTAYQENVCFDVYGANSLYNWELFFHAPLYIATRLSKNGKYKEAMKWFHYIFDPTTDQLPGPGESEISRYWKVLPFKTTPTEGLEDWFKSLAPNTNPDTENPIIGEWRDHPFDPHKVAANRPIAYMKHVVIKYVENLIAWGDSLFRQFQRESVNEALQLYVIANHILGPRPEFVPKRGNFKAESYDSLKNRWDDFSNALVELENIFPYSSQVPVSNTSTITNLLGVGPTLYFCIPSNEKIIDYWDIVADRLEKIRHCKDIDGVERKLALFSPPIDPGALIQATSQGLSLGSILSDLSSPPPIYRFEQLIQKAIEFCSDVKVLGSALLAALEKKDAEELGRLRGSHETQMLELMAAVRERQVLDAKTNKENLGKARETAEFRLNHYIDLLGNDSITPPPSPTISASLNADSQLPPDTNIVRVETDVDESLVDSDESGVKLIAKEKSSLDKSNEAKWWLTGAGAADTLAGIFNMIVQGSADGKPFGVGAGVVWGGINLGTASSAVASFLKTVGQHISAEASLAATMASYIRREQDWTLQANLAAREIIQLDKQITSADIRIQVAEKELENHNQQIENSKKVELFLKDKFTNQELYQWMKEQLFAVYKQSYNLAFDMAQKAEKAYKFQMGTESASFIRYGYWDNSQQGLVAGEKLQMALRQIEKAYIENNRRELELTKNVSLARLNPLSLIELRETGKCYLSLPEEFFDLDYRGHYFRRLKAVRISIPCVTGPYTAVSCTLRLLKNSVRTSTSLAGQYEQNNDEGLLIDDVRFRTTYTPVTAIATSSAKNDSGTFEFNFRDERYLPFEFAGAISAWQIELSTEKELRPFDYATISDVILHINYTARESGGLFKQEAMKYIKNYIKNATDLNEQPLMQLIDIKNELPNEWHKFLNPGTDKDQVLKFTPGKQRFPYFTKQFDIIPRKIEMFAISIQDTNYLMNLSYLNRKNIVATNPPLDMIQNQAYGGVNKATVVINDDLEAMDIEKEVTIKLKRSGAGDFKSLTTNPDELDDIFMVIHYKLKDKVN